MLGFCGPCPPPFPVSCGPILTRPVTIAGGKPRWVDGALVYDVRVPFGYWEAKDEEDDLDKEIAAKFRRGYPRDNIIFEDSKTAVLIQHGNEVMRCPVDDTGKLPHLLDLFFN